MSPGCGHCSAARSQTQLDAALWSDSSLVSQCYIHPGDDHNDHDDHDRHDDDQVDLCAEEMGNSCGGSSSVSLQGDIRATVARLSQCLQDWSYPATAPWWSTLSTKMEQNIAATQSLVEDNSLPLNYYAAFAPVCKHLDKVDIIL